MHRTICTVLVALCATLALGDEDTIEMSPLCDGSITGTTYDLAAINDIVGGDWNQLGRAQRITLGTTVNPFQIIYDDVRSQLIIHSPDGPRLRLRPFSQAKLADVPLTVNNLRENQISYISQDGSKTVRFTGNDLEVLKGCPLEDAPSFYWTYTSGDKQSYGVLVFLSEDTGMGVIGNSAGGSRTTLLYR